MPSAGNPPVTHHSAVALTSRIAWVWEVFRMDIVPAGRDNRIPPFRSPKWARESFNRGFHP
jgi:hypothetical protein